jgi:hypothetical protein
MLKHTCSFLFLLIILLSAAWTSSAQVSKLSPDDSLIKEFRIIRKQYSDKPQTKDKWGSRYHVLLTRLGDTLGNPAYSRSDIVALMGSPDYTVNKNNYSNADMKGIYPPISYTLKQKKYNRKTEYLVYCWRGNHDFLFFEIKKGKVQKASWWMALE